MKKGLLTVLLVVLMMGFVFGQMSEEKGYVTIHDAYGSTCYYTPEYYNTDIYVSNDPYYHTVVVESTPYSFWVEPVYVASYPSSYVEVTTYPYTTCYSYETEYIYYNSMPCYTYDYTYETTIYNSYPTYPDFAYMGN